MMVIEMDESSSLPSFLSVPLYYSTTILPPLPYHTRLPCAPATYREEAAFR